MKPKLKNCPRCQGEVHMVTRHEPHWDVYSIEHKTETRCMTCSGFRFQVFHDGANLTMENAWSMVDKDIAQDLHETGRCHLVNLTERETMGLLRMRFGKTRGAFVLLYFENDEQARNHLPGVETFALPTHEAIGNMITAGLQSWFESGIDSGERDFTLRVPAFLARLAKGLAEGMRDSDDQDDLRRMKPEGQA